MKKQDTETKYAIYDDSRGQFLEDIFFDKQTMEEHINEAYGSDDVSELVIYKLITSNLKVSSKIHIEEE